MNIRDLGQPFFYGNQDKETSFRFHNEGLYPFHFVVISGQPVGSQQHKCGGLAAESIDCFPR